MEDKIRHVLALILILSFLGIIGYLIIYPYQNELQGLTGNDNVMIKYLDKTASLFTGIIGVIIGYYFGNKNNNNAS